MLGTVLQNNEFSLNVGSSFKLLFTEQVKIGENRQDLLGLGLKETQTILRSDESNESLLKLQSFYFDENPVYDEMFLEIVEYYDKDGELSTEARCLREEFYFGGPCPSSPIAQRYSSTLSTDIPYTSEEVFSEDFSDWNELIDFRLRRLDENFTGKFIEKFSTNQGIELIVFQFLHINEDQSELQAFEFITEFVNGYDLYFEITISVDNYITAKNIVSSFEALPQNITLNQSDNKTSSQTGQVVQSEYSSGNPNSTWKASDWFGVFFEASNGWIFHPDLGWLYAEDSSADKTWLYADKKGWLWTSKEAYPYLYSHDSTNWIYVVKEDDKPTQAYDYNPGKWSLWQELTLRVIINPNPDQSASKTSENQAIEKVLDSEKSDSSKIREIAEIIKAKL